MTKTKASIMRDEEGTPTIIKLQKGGRRCTIKYDSTIGFQVEGNLTPEFAGILAATAIFGKTQVSGDVSSDVNLVQVGGVDVAAPTVAACVPTSIENPALAYDSVNDRFKVDVEATVGALEAGGNLETIAGKDFATQTTLAALNTYYFAHCTADAQVKSAAGRLHTVTINTVTTGGVLTIYDNTAESGTVIAVITLAANDKPVTLTYDVLCGTGIYAGFDGTLAADVVISYI